LSVLADSQIKYEILKGRISIDPLDYDDIQPASVDLHLGTHFRMFDDRDYELHYEIDPYLTTPNGISIPSVPKMIETHSQGPLRLRPGQFVLGHTIEHVKVSPTILGRLEGKSSLGRLGLAVHITAGFFDPGWDGIPTLEIVNFSPFPWVLRPGQPICQMAFDHMNGTVERPYGTANNHYQGSKGVVSAWGGYADH
jgi:dCTP deaminase